MRQPRIEDLSAPRLLNILRDPVKEFQKAALSSRELEMARQLALLELAAQNPTAICQPAFAGRTGHPVIVPRIAFAELKNTGAATLKEFLAKTDCPRLACLLEDPGVLADMDTPEDYQRLKSDRAAGSVST